MDKITESAVEAFAIELLERQGYRSSYGPDLAPDGDTPARASFEDILLVDRLRIAVARINHTVPSEARDDAIKQLTRLSSPELVAGNEIFHRMLTEGVSVSYQKGAQTRGDLVWLVDWSDPEANDFEVVNQFTVVEEGVNKRPDLILFVNGLPLVVVELKEPCRRKCDRAFGLSADPDL